VLDVPMVLGGLLLAVVFATAGVAKLADLEGSRRAVAAFGVPGRLVAPLGTLLPPAELATAALLAAGALAGGGGAGALRAGSLSALVLLSLFSAGIAVSLARGRSPDCHCFGQLHSAPASVRTLARNGVLLTLAAFVAGGGELAGTLAAAVAMLAIVGGVGLRTRGRRLDQAGRQGEGLPLGTAAPDFELPSLGGARVTLAGLLERGRAVVLVFTDPGCGPCVALAPQVARWQRRHSDELTIAVVERLDGSNGDEADEHGRRDLLLQRDREVADAYRAAGTPSAVLVSAEGRIASGVAGGGPAIEGLLARTLPGFERRPATETAVLAPAPLGRRELLARGATAATGITGLLGVPAWAKVVQLELKCRFERCGDRCCPKRAKCEGRGDRKVCVCPDGRPACGERCCPETFVCRRIGRRRRRRLRCVCPQGYVVCAGRCVRARTDPRHCGRCGHECPTATSCVDGECVGGDGTGSGPGGSGGCDCPRGQTCCEGQCIDLNADELHCGRCAQPCPEGETCCEGTCRRLDSDPENCGRCGQRCASGEVCSQGRCRRRCRGGLRNCGGHCVDTVADRGHCGGCGRSCDDPFGSWDCCNGECCSYNASLCCPGGCVNPAFDDENCGGCGIVCPPDSYCRAGACSGSI
jgi:thiol-disulfide isomerase/thioredoxin